MNKKILSLLAGTFLFGATYAQNHEITVLGGNGQDIVNTVMTVEITTNDYIYMDWNVKNVSGLTVQSIVARRVIDPVTGWTDQVCYGNASGGTCVDPPSNDWVMNSSDAVTLADNETALANLKIHPDAPDNSHYRYYFGTPQDPYQDSVDVFVKNVLAVKELKKNISLTVSPNPASDFLSVKVPGVDKGTLKVVDVLGNVIMIENFSGSKTINTSSFKNGVYFVSITGEGFTSVTRKVVVRH